VSRSLLWTLLALGALLRVAALGWPGTLDVPDWKATSAIASSDLVRIYGAGGWPPDERKLEWAHISVTTEYPPVSHYEMAIVGLAYRQVSPEFTDGPLLTAFIKTPGLIAETLFVVMLLTWGARVMGREPATWIALAFWLNPVVWLGGAVLGYLDAQMAVPVTLAFLAASGRRFRMAGVLAAIAVLTKPQAIFALPALAFVVGRRDDRTSWRPLVEWSGAGLAVGVLAVLPFVVAGTWPSLLRATQRLGEHDLVSGTATNLWWLVTWAAGGAARVQEIGLWEALTRPATMVRISTVLGWGLPNPRTIGTVLTLGALGWAAWRSRHGLSLATGALVAGWCVLAYFMVSGQVHENHSYLAVPLLAVAAGVLPHLRRLFWLTSAAIFANLYLFYGLGEGRPPAIDRSWTVVDMSLLLAVAFAGLFVAWTRRVVLATSPAAGRRSEV